MRPEIKTLTEKKLVGNRLSMSMAENRTFELWKGFMPRRKEITNKQSTDLFSMQIYNSLVDASVFNPSTVFEKWAAVEVTDFEHIPDGMETYVLAGGLYAVFLHKGAAQTGATTFQYIFQIWLPASDYVLDTRPHFELLGEKYKNNDPDSEEEIWIPIKKIVNY